MLPTPKCSPANYSKANHESQEGDILKLFLQLQKTCSACVVHMQYLKGPYSGTYTGHGNSMKAYYTSQAQPL